MQVDDAPLKISKWPFYLGDVLLVAIALAIAILGDWQLSDWQVVACVLSVALGAGLFVLPYLVEYSMRMKEVREDRDAHIRVLRSHMQQAEVAIEALETRYASGVDSSAAETIRQEELEALVEARLEPMKALWARVTEQERRLNTALVQLDAEQEHSLPEYPEPGAAGSAHR